MKKIKLFLSIFTCCLAFSVLSFGVYATLTNIQFKLSGSIQFTIPMSYFASDWKTRLTDSKVISNVNEIASIQFLDSQPSDYDKKIEGSFSTNNQYIIDENGEKVNDTSSANSISCYYKIEDNLYYIAFVSSAQIYAPIDCTGLFAVCTSTKEIIFDNFSTENVINFDSMFALCSSLKKIDVSAFDTSKVTNMSSMFSFCSNLTEIDMSMCKSGEGIYITSTTNMFSYCPQLTTIKLGSFNMIELSFSDLTNLQTLTFGENFNTSEMTSMSSMFSGCSSLQQIDLSKFNTSNVTDMTNMFSGCSMLESINLSKINTSKVTNMSYMFSKCSSLQQIDLNKFDTSLVTDMRYMFSGCSSLTEIDMSMLKSGEGVYITNTSSMFSGCTQLKIIKLGAFNMKASISFSKLTNLTTLTFADGFDFSECTSSLFDFSGCTSFKELDMSYLSSTKPVTLNFNGWRLTNLQTLKLGNFKVKELSFSGLTNLQTLTFGENFDTSAMTSTSSMRSMFSECSSLQQIDLSKFNISNVTDMSSMFYKCSSLKEIDMSMLKSGEGVYITDTSSMFYGCTALETIKLGSFNMKASISFSNLTNLTTLTFADEFDFSECTSPLFNFSRCTSFKELDMSYLSSTKPVTLNFNGWGLTNLQTLKLGNFKVKELSFSGLTNLQTLTFGENFDTSAMTSMSSMFKNCSSLQQIDLSKFNTSNVTDMSYMFSGCSSLSEIDLSKFDTSLVTYMEYMFQNCSSLTDIKFGDKFKTDIVTSMSYMFDGCEKLQSMDLSLFNFDSCTSYSNMFRNCGSVGCEIILPTNVSKAISLSGAGSWVQIINGEAQTDSIKVTLNKLEWNGSEKHIIKKIA